jgi:3-deoxy-D-manno-octulosonic-acid transferase
LDIAVWTNKFLNHWKPNLSIFIDSEIWPNLITQISEKKIPLILINARITKKSFERWKFIISFAKKIFEKFDLCIASNKESENFLKVLGAKNVKNYGNLKFTSIKTDLNKKLNLNFLDKIKNRKVWCAASTHPTEEILCAKAHLKIKESYSNILTIIIPRHIDRIVTIQKELSNLNLKTALYSDENQIDINTDILLIDKYGETLKFYQISKCVFMGKSIAKSLIMNSGQNPIEAARLGCKILHGPNLSNFVEIYEHLKEMDVTKQINNADELGLSLVEEFKEDRENKVKKTTIRGEIDNYGQNILNNVVEELKKYI